jgi:hypothetical protein
MKLGGIAREGPDGMETRLSGIGVLRNRLGQPEAEGWEHAPRPAD